MMGARNETSGGDLVDAHRAELPRIYELRSLLRHPQSPNAYFQNFDLSLSDYPVKLKHFRDLEADLRGLDPAAWDHLKSRVAPLFEIRDAQRGWQAAFDLLNQAKAYKHLRNAGAIDIQFVPESQVAGQKTPDLEAVLGGQRLLCEVKTINVSDVEAKARVGGDARGVQGTLPQAFFTKVSASLRVAAQQMDAFRPHEPAHKLAYVILNFDDNLNEYVDRYRPQLEAFVANPGVPGIEIVFDFKPAFYSASL
ncbi:MAG: hypothetical protein WDN03_07525 [Rhizomicrobium sp.]